MASDPDKIGPYVILERLGAGGMAMVYHGQHGRTGREVALKTVLTDKPSHVQSIQREMRYLPRLSHPGVVRLLDSGTWQEARPWYAMELLQGQPLSVAKTRWWPGDGPHTESTLSVASDEALPKPAVPRAVPLGPASTLRSAKVTGLISAPDPLPPAAGGHLDEVLEIAYRLCDPLAYIHGEGIVHRDLKPSNIFLRTDGTPVLLDFGVVGVFEAASGRGRLDVQRSRAGTRAYMAPEQLRGDPVDSRADLYAFGVLLFELLTGHVPFEGDTETQAALRLSSTPPAPSQLVAGVPPQIDKLVLRLMAKESRDRYGHADDVAAILAPLVADRVPEARAESQRPGRSVFLYRAELSGRNEILRDIEGQLQKAANGEGTLIMVGGESGVGKTHFASHVGRTASMQHHAVIVGECAPLGEAGDRSIDLKNAPLHPLRGLLRAVADKCRGANGDAAKMVETLLGSDAALLVPYEPALADVIASPAATTADPAVPDTRQALFRVLAHALRAMSQIQPLLLVLDDLQWADELTLDFLTWMPPDLLADSPLVILGTYRSEDAGRLTDLVQRPRCLHITLNRLDAAAIGQMVGDMLAMSGPTDHLTQILIEHSEGNPFFAAEYLRMAVSEGHFVREQGRWKLAVDNGTPVNLRAIRLPRSLSELLGHRLDQLSPAAQQVGQAAAVLGRKFEEPLLVSLLHDQDEPDRSQGIHQLLRLQLLEETSTGCYRFRHDKMREALYARIPAQRRRQLHAAAAAAVLAAHQTEADFAFHYAELAHHFQQADQVEQAREYLEKAAELALRQFAHRDAISLFTELLGQDGLRPDGDASGAAAASEAAGANGSHASCLRQVRWHRRLAEAHHGLGDLDATTKVGTLGLRLAGYRLPTSPRAWIGCLARNVPIQVMHRALQWRWASRQQAAHELAMEAALIVQRLGQRYYFLDALAMITSSLWSVNLAERARTSERVAMPYALLGTATGIYRMHGVSAKYFALARSAAETSGDVPGQIFADYSEATVASGQCRWDDARALLQRAMDEADATGNHTEAQIARTVLANAAHFNGRFVESRQEFLHILDVARSHDNHQHIAWGLYGAARAMIPLGQLKEARSLLEEAWAVLVPQPEVPSKIICQGLLAGVHRRLGNRTTALEHADVALRLIRGNNLVAYANVTGYAETIETYLTSWHAGPEGNQDSKASKDATSATRSSAGRALGYLRKLRWPLPIVRPAYLRLRAQRKWAQGRLGAACVDLEKAAALANALGLPYEEALACLGVASLVASADSRWQRAMNRANQLCIEMRCQEIRAPFGDLRVNNPRHDLQEGASP